MITGNCASYVKKDFMRVSTKLRIILKRYDLNITAKPESNIQIIATDKLNIESGVFEGKNYSDVIDKVFKYQKIANADFRKITNTLPK